MRVVKRTLLGSFSRDTKLSFNEFCNLVGRNRDGDPPALAERKKGRGLGARKRRAREARALRAKATDRLRGLPNGHWYPRRTIREWLERVSAPAL